MRLRTIFAAVALSATLVACTSSKATVSDPSTPATSPSVTTGSSEPTTSVSTSPTPDPRVQAAVSAYRKFGAAADNAQRHPRKVGGAFPAGTDFRPYTFDPFLTQFDGYILSLSTDGLAYRGIAPVQRVKVVSANLASSPPAVTLVDCQLISPTWREYVVATGKDATIVNPPAVPPPYLVTVQIIEKAGRWGVVGTKADTSRTCAG